MVTSAASTMSSTAAPRLRSQTGLRNPCRKGPMACAPANSCASLYAMLPASSEGKTSTFGSANAAPFFAAMTGFSAASACRGPENPVATAAARTASTDGPDPEAPVEKESSATRAAPKSACAVAADARAMAAMPSASGATFTAQSAQIISRPSGNRMRKNEDGSVTPSARPTARPAASITFFVGLSAPATIASTSPAATIAAARISGLSSIFRASGSFRPRAATSAEICASVTESRPTASASDSAARRSMADATRGSLDSGNTIRILFWAAAVRARSRTDIGFPFDFCGRLSA